MESRPTSDADSRAKKKARAFGASDFFGMLEVYGGLTSRNLQEPFKG
jgi:hypothetical protein